MKRLALLLTSLLALLGLIAILYALAPGVGVSPDSAAYIASARSLLKGYGLSIPTGIDDPLPMTHFAPFYPFLLALLGRLGLDPEQGAKWLNVILFPSTIFLAGLIISRSMKDLVLLAPLASLSLLLSEDLLRIHAYAWSEPLFIFLSTLGLFLFTRYLVHPPRLGWVGPIVLLSLAFLTRYAGAALIPTIFLGTILTGKETLPKRFMRALGLSLACALPSLLWFVRNYILTGNLSDRGLAYHPLTSRDSLDALGTFSNWFLPGRITGTVRDVLTAIVLAGFTILIVIALYKNRRVWMQQEEASSTQILPFIFFTFAFAYFMLLVFTLLFMDAQSTFDYRLLSPIFVSGTIALFSLTTLYLKRIAWPIQLLAGILLFLVLTFNAVHALKFIARSHAGSYKMYAGPGWQEAEIIELVRALPEGLPIYSNGDEAIYFTTGKPAARFPQKFSPFTLKANQGYDLELDGMREILETRGGVIVCFSGITWRGYLPGCDELTSTLPLMVLWTGEEGEILRFIHE
jgi:hypothetical protein